MNRRRSRTVVNWSVYALGAAAVVGLMRSAPARPPAPGQSRTICHLTHDWRLKSWSFREIEWDEPLPEQPACQADAVWVRQLGPLVAETRRRVSPRPGEASR